MSHSVVYKRELCFVSESVIFKRKAKGRLFNVRSVGVTRADPSSTDHPADDAGTSEALWAWLLLWEPLNLVHPQTWSMQS